MFEVLTNDREEHTDQTRRAEQTFTGGKLFGPRQFSVFWIQIPDSIFILRSRPLQPLSEFFHPPATTSFSSLLFSSASSSLSHHLLARCTFLVVFFIEQSILLPLNSIIALLDHACATEKSSGPRWQGSCLEEPDFQAPFS